MTPARCNVYLSSKTVETDQKEKWYGTEFAKSKFSADLLKAMVDPQPEEGLGLPPKNIFIPASVEVKTDADKSVTLP